MMKLQLLLYDGLPADQALQDERLASLRGLAASACYGLFAQPGESQAFWSLAGLLDGRLPNAVRRAGGGLQLQSAGGDAGAALEGDVAAAARHAAPAIDAALQLDAALARLLDGADESTVIGLLMHSGASGGFVIADPLRRVLGEFNEALPADCLATLLELVGLPADGAGISLVGRAAGAYSTDDEDVIRERLSGLGYI